MLGPLASLERTPLKTVGYTGGVHELLDVRLASGDARRLVLKRTWPARDWVAWHSADRVGREAALLDEPGLSGVWGAFASRGGEVGLLMEDLTEHLIPDADEPIGEADEDALLAALAALHARYWNSEVLRLPWLAPPSAQFGLLGPGSADKDALGVRQDPFYDAVRRGWAAAFDRLPEAVANVLALPADVLARRCARLPHTLRHGDAKAANFALLPGAVAAFDWALVGAGPPTLDLGWYLAVNSSRLARSKDDVVARYRRLLESELGAPIAHAVWEEMASVGVLGGALMLLWAKALALDGASGAATDEWNWWVDELRRRA